MLPLFHDNFILIEATSSHFFRVTTSTQQLLFRVSYFFFLSGFSFTDTDDPQNSRRREETIFYSTLPLPSAHEHSDIYVQLCAWDDYHRFLIATLTFTRLLLDEIYHLIELPFDWLMLWSKFLFVYLMILYQVFVTATLIRDTSELELSSTITLVLQANQLIKWPSHLQKVFRGAAVFQNNSSFFRTVTFLQELFFQNTLFLGAKIQQTSHFLKIGSSLRQLLFGTAIFFGWTV